MATAKQAPWSPRAGAIGRRRGEDERIPARGVGANRSAHLDVAEIQRARIVAATFDVVFERGAANVTVAQVVERSGVSRRTFYESFADREDCLLAAFEQAVAYASERVLPAYSASGAWRERIRSALLALLRFLDEEPVIGRLLIAESLSAGTRTLARRARLLAQVTEAVAAGREQARSAPATPLAADGVVGGALSVLQARISAPEREPVIGLANPLMSMIVLPYLGSAAARRELERELPPLSMSEDDRSAPLLFADPFKEAGMRMTHRTLCVLAAIDEHPNASNRQVGLVAGVGDQGQTSKLLARLQRAGLIANTVLHPGQGAPNAWTLTPRGRRVAHGIPVRARDTRDASWVNG